MILLATIGISLFFIFYDTLAHIFPTLFQRFTGEGLKSGRYTLWIYALQHFLDYPFGGFSVPFQLDHVRWFHNFWLDTAAEAGWIPLSFLITANFILITQFFYTKKSFDIYTLWLFSMLLLLLFSQDVIMQGNIRLLVAYIVIGAILAKLVNTKHRKYEKVFYE